MGVNLIYMFPRLSWVCIHLEMWAEVKVHPYHASAHVCVGRWKPSDTHGAGYTTAECTAGNGSRQTKASAGRLVQVQATTTLGGAVHKQQRWGKPITQDGTELQCTTASIPGTEQGTLCPPSAPHWR